MENLDDLNAGASGRLRLLSRAVDFTEDRLPPGAKQAIVRSFMVHHQGMILLALLNYLHGDMCWSSAFTPTSAWKT
ncbi:MAG: hypothetical protein R2854_20535 [Caldilineaceae bacterium]